MEKEEKQKLFEDFESSTYEEWKEAAEKLLKGVPFEKKMYTHTPEGIRLEPIYNLEDVCPPSNENFPGFSRYRRATKATGYLNPAWSIMQEESSPFPEKWHENCLSNLKKGLDGINVHLNAQSKDCQLSENIEECCLSGLFLKDYKDFKKAFDSIPLTEYPVFMNCGINTEVYLALFHASMGEEIKALKGTLGNDPLGRLVETGKIAATLDEVFDSMVRIIKWKRDNAPGLKTILIDTTPYHNAGASAVEELSIAFSTAVYYINELLDRGLAIDEITNEFTFSFSVASYFFMEIAKLRAARILWTNIVEAYDGQKESGKITIHARTSSRTQTIYDPYVNMLRDTSQAFSAVLGGVDSLHVSPFEERKGLISDFSKRIAKNVQLILKEECHLNMPIDPTGGTWYIEKVTDELSQKAWERFQQIEEKGGIIPYYNEGFAEKEIEKSRLFRQKEFTTRKRGIVGNNMYPNLFESPLSVDADQEKKAKEQLFADISRAKDASKDSVCFETPIQVKKISEVLKTGASLQALSQGIFKGNTTVKPLEVHRDAELFEQLRETSCEIKAKTGKLPEVFCANFSKLAVHKPRTDFTKGFFEVGGFDVLAEQSFEDIEEAVEKVLASKAKIVVICSSDKVYPEVVVPFTQKIKAKDNSKKVILAGRPDKSLADDYIKAGLDDFIFVKTDVYDFLKKAQDWVKEQGGEGLQ